MRKRGLLIVPLLVVLLTACGNAGQRAPFEAASGSPDPSSAPTGTGSPTAVTSSAAVPSPSVLSSPTSSPGTGPGPVAPSPGPPAVEDEEGSAAVPRPTLAVAPGVGARPGRVQPSRTASGPPSRSTPARAAAGARTSHTPAPEHAPSAAAPARPAPKRSGTTEAAPSSAAPSSAAPRPSSSSSPRAALLVGGYRGANLTPKYGQGWPQVWREWDWSGWIKPQIDAAKRSGANGVRFIGGVGGVLYSHREQGTDRDLSMQDYLAHTKQFLDYTRQQGLYVYATGGDFAQLPAGFGRQELIDALREWLAVVDASPNVIGVDLMQESFYERAFIPGGDTDAGVHAYLRAVLKGVRSATRLPLTFSQPGNGGSKSAKLFVDPQVQVSAQYMDFLDFHVYYAAKAADLEPLRRYGKPVLIGETGGQLGIGVAGVADRLRAIGAVSSRVSGAFVWAISDMEIDPARQMGMYDALFRAREPLVTAFGTWSRKAGGFG